MWSRGYTYTSSIRWVTDNRRYHVIYIIYALPQAIYLSHLDGLKSDDEFGHFHPCAPKLYQLY